MITEQQVGGPLVGLAAVFVSAVATVLALTPAAVLGFFYSGDAADLAMLLVLAVIARVVYVFGYGGY